MVSSYSNSQNGPTTSPTLLNRLKLWNYQTAWNNFILQYNPLFEKWARGKLRNAADVQDLNQQVSLEVAQRLSSFDYDSKRSFRGWLRTLYFSRLLDFLKAERRRQWRDQYIAQLRRQSFVVDENDSTNRLTTSVQAASNTGNTGVSSAVAGETGAINVRDQHAFAQQIQTRVRGRVSEKTWAIFWEIAVQGNSIADTAQRYSMRYASTFAAYSRVHKMLQQEASMEVAK